jgi:prefoldin subunit 5
MIRFFRTLRQRLPIAIGTENKVSRYLLYALGEILLVVIGILIALQVNQWTEEEKNLDTEIRILSSLKEDLNTDLANLNYKITVDSFVSANNKDLMVNLRAGNIAEATKVRKNGTLVYNQLGGINRVYFFNPQRFAYESLKLAGIDIIQNEALRQSIVNLYDYQYKRTEDYLQVQFDMLVDSNPNLWNHLETRGGLFTKYPTDTIAFKADGKFLNFVSHFAFEYDEAISFYERNREALQLLLNDIDKELKTLQNP